MANLKKCDCWVAIAIEYDNNEDYHLSDFEEHSIAYERSKQWLTEPINKNLLDNTYFDRDCITKFDFCPLCGKKIDWSVLDG